MPEGTLEITGGAEINDAYFSVDGNTPAESLGMEELLTDKEIEERFERITNLLEEIGTPEEEELQTTHMDSKPGGARDAESSRGGF